MRRAGPAEGVAERRDPVHSPHGLQSVPRQRLESHGDRLVRQQGRAPGSARRGRSTVRARLPRRALEDVPPRGPQPQGHEGDPFRCVEEPAASADAWTARARRPRMLPADVLDGDERRARPCIRRRLPSSALARAEDPRPTAPSAGRGAAGQHRTWDGNARRSNVGRGADLRPQRRPDVARQGPALSARRSIRIAQHAAAMAPRPLDVCLGGLPLRRRSTTAP